MYDLNRNSEPAGLPELLTCDQWHLLPIGSSAPLGTLEGWQVKVIEAIERSIRRLPAGQPILNAGWISFQRVPAACLHPRLKHNVLFKPMESVS